MNSAQLIYRGKLRLSFDIPFLDTPSYLHASHLYTSTLFYISTYSYTYSSTYSSARASTYISTRISTYISLYLLIYLFIYLIGG